MLEAFDDFVDDKKMANAAHFVLPRRSWAYNTLQLTFIGRAGGFFIYGDAALQHCRWRIFSAFKSSKQCDAGK